MRHRAVWRVLAAQVDARIMDGRFKIKVIHDNLVLYGILPLSISSVTLIKIHTGNQAAGHLQ